MVAKKSINKDELYNFYIVQNHSLNTLAEYYRCSKNTIIRHCKEHGFSKSYQDGPKDNSLQEFLIKHHLQQGELEKILKGAKQPEPERERIKSLDYPDKRVIFTVISDLHMGHKNYRPDILEHAVKYSKQLGSEFFLIPGDILEGMSGRDGHIYELSHLGATNQLNYGIEQLGQIEKPIFGITATNSHDGWFNSKGDIGFEVGPELERRLENFEFLGYDEADLVLSNGLKIKMTHPGDGVAYAVSYKLQKYLNALPGGQKPDVLFQGHYHKAMYMFYRNVHAFDAGCLQDQTIFMKKKQTPAMTGYWIIDVANSKKGVDKIKSEFVPFFQ